MQNYRCPNVERRDCFSAVSSHSWKKAHNDRCTYLYEYIARSGTNCAAHCRWTDRMNGYDAIMQGRHGLRNATQPTDTDYYRYIRLERIIYRGERRRGKREAGWRKREENERDITHASSGDSSVGRKDFFSFSLSRIFISREMTSRCTLRAMKDSRFL